MTLTRQQNLIYQKIVEGYSNVQIGDFMGLSEKGVKFHVTSILKTFKVTSRSELIAKHFDSKKQEEKGAIMSLVKSELSEKKVKTQEEKIQYIDESFHIGATINQLHHMMKTVTEEQINPATVNAACNCVARLNETINTAIQAARFLNER